MNNTLAVAGNATNWRKSCLVEMSFDRLVPVILKIIFTYAIHAKLHTTNYYNTFIEVAEDSKAPAGNKPAAKGEKQAVAEMQYALFRQVRFIRIFALWRSLNSRPHEAFIT